MAPVTWLLLSSRLPREPSRLRLAVWRRMRRLGAVLVNDAIWVVPAEPRTRESFEWLVQEIGDAGGSAYAWEASSLGGAQDQELVARFRSESEARCQAIVAEGEKVTRAARSRRKANRGSQRRALRALTRALRLERQRDWFRSPAWPAADRALKSALRAAEEAESQETREG